MQFNPSLWLFLLAISIPPLLISVPALADVSQATARKLQASGQILPLETIRTKAKAIQPGKVIETELEIKHGLYVYEVELLDSKGTVWEVKLDARTGALIELEED